MSIINNFIPNNIKHRPGLVKIIHNVTWLVLDHGIRILFGIFISILLANHLGPVNFGILNLAYTLTILLCTIPQLGLQSIVVRDLVENSESAGVTLGSAAFIQLTSGFVTYLILIGTIVILYPNNFLLLSIAPIMGLLLYLESIKAGIYWFEAKVNSKYTVLVQNIVFLIFIPIKVMLILNGIELIYYIWALVAETALGLLILLKVMAQQGGPSFYSFRVSSEKARTLLKNSWPIFLSAICIAIYLKIDVIMLGSMVGDKEVGIYSVAARISELWYIIAMSIGSSVLPKLIENKKQSEKLYNAAFQKLYDVMAIISYVISIIVILFSETVIGYFYKIDYLGAALILKIHICACIFVFLGVAGGKWFLIENRLILGLQRGLLGALTNIILNLWLIPIYGGVGAALSTVASYALVGFGIDIFQKETRGMFSMKAKALNPFGVYRRYKRGIE